MRNDGNFIMIYIILALNSYLSTPKFVKILTEISLKLITE